MNENEMPNCPECGEFSGVILANAKEYGSHFCANCCYWFTPVNENAKQADETLDSLSSAPADQPNQLNASLKSTFDKCYGIVQRKSHDYAGSVNPYKNFETVVRLGISVQQGIMIRLLDKITRLENLLTVNPYVTEETFEDTIDDAINYLAILKARRQLEGVTKN